MAVSFPGSRAVLACALLLAVSCAPLIAPFSLEAYKNATSLKAETLALMADAGEPFDRHAAEVRTMKVKLSAAQEFAAGMPKNELSAEQWEIMNDPDGGLAGEYWEVWREQGTISGRTMTDQIRQVGQAFDEIICLEANKEKNTDCVTGG